MVCELNNGQLKFILNATFTQFEFAQYNKIQGLPFGANELSQKFKTLLK